MVEDTMRPFMIAAKMFDSPKLLTHWRWLVPTEFTPMMISIFGDWVLGAPDGSIWALSMLEGTFDGVALSATEFDLLKADFDWLDQVFMAGWQEIAERKGLIPTSEECIGWTIHPLLGGKFDSANLSVFSMHVYQALMGQLHMQTGQVGRS